MEFLDAVLYRLAYLATANPTVAQGHVRRVLALDARSPPEFVACLMRQLEKELPRRGKDFQQIEAVLRADITTEVDLPECVKRSDLLWKLKRTCLARTLNCVAPGPRLTFILCSVYGASFHEAAEMLGISGTVVISVRFSRALSCLERYLEPRCEHLDPRNPCRCDNRLGVALKNRFIDYSHSPAPQTDYRTRRAHGPSELYAHLPILQPSSI